MQKLNQLLCSPYYISTPNSARLDTNVRLLNVGDANAEDVSKADAVAFGCPSMGSEELEESEMEPFIESIASVVNGKNIILFGSYGWGNG
ncbi:hypothetical protein G9F72_010015 [Clostridium estertheticum]|uniref:hypothetical protein n=1 Tax=Clostridium estertheticum TaxID=238834 RepID=UPI0013E9348D|nr:hypothetical protein [Clostridium estertheticum]MBZ9686661.1 hypothetical protein [Clostridium estertheticum]